MKCYKRYIVGLLLGVSGYSYGYFFCAEGGSEIRGNIYEVCGTGYGVTKRQGIEDSLVACYKEFDKLCDKDANCEGHEILVSPKRVVCSKPGLYFCQRLVEIEVLPSVTKREAAMRQIPSNKWACAQQNPFVYTIALTLRTVLPVKSNPCYPW